jgi:hypothetical protein
LGRIIKEKPSGFCISAEILVPILGQTDEIAIHHSLEELTATLVIHFQTLAIKFFPHQNQIRENKSNLFVISLYHHLMHTSAARLILHVTSIRLKVLYRFSGDKSDLTNVGSTTRPTYCGIIGGERTIVPNPRWNLPRLLSKLRPLIELVFGLSNVI